MFGELDIKQVVQDVKEIYPELRDFPQSRMIGEFCIEPTEDGGVKIFDSTGEPLLTLWFDDEGNIVGYDDYLNQQCVAGSPEENYFCDPESEFCWPADDFGQTQNYAMYFCEETEPPAPPAQPKAQQTQTAKQETGKVINEYKLTADTGSSAYSHVVIGAVMDESVSSAAIFAAAEAFADQTGYVPTFQVCIAHTPSSDENISFVSEGHPAKGLTVRASDKPEAPEADLPAADTAGRSLVLFVVQAPKDSSTDSDLFEYPNTQESSAAQQASSSRQPQFLLDTAGQLVFADSEITLIAQLEKRNGHDDETQGIRASTAKNVEEKYAAAETRTNSCSAEAIEGPISDIPEPVFVGWPVVSARMDISTAPVSAKGQDEQSSKTVAIVKDDNGASRHQGDPNENHGGQSGEEQSEDGEDE
jgi:hypothetical protein